MTPAEIETQYIVDICHHEACLCPTGEVFRPLEMLQSTDIADTASSDNQPDVPRPQEATAGSRSIHPSSTPTTTPMTTGDNEIPDFFKPGYVVQIPLHTLQDVIRAKTWSQLVSSQKRAVLSDLQFSFRALYDGVDVDGITSIRVARFTHAHRPHLDPARELAACLRLHSQDSRIPARALNMFNEVTKDGGVWIARHWTDESRNLEVGSNVWLWYYNFFKDISIRKEGKDWDGADLESVVEFLADLRAR